jgi:hypothetical protein
MALISTEDLSIPHEGTKNMALNGVTRSITLVNARISLRNLRRFYARRCSLTALLPAMKP